MQGSIIVGQSGGPTAVINSSLAGVVKTAKDRGAKKIYGMLHGIQGFLDEKYDEYHNEVISVKQVDKVKEWLLGVNNKLMENRSNLSLKSDELKMKKEEILVKEE